MANGTSRGKLHAAIRAASIAACFAAAPATASSVAADAAPPAVAGLASPVAGDTGDEAALCVRAIDMAAAQTGVPADLLHAIARVESGRRGKPWPWAINLDGTGVWHDSRATLEAHVLHLQAMGETSFDIGCFQINTRWHGANFDSLAAIADPDANALYAARFLRRLHAEFDTWEGATGAYHSRTPARAASYLARVEGQRARPAVPTRPPSPPELVAVARAPAAARVATAYPLLHAAGGQGAAPGSTVPIMAARPPFLVGWAAP